MLWSTVADSRSTDPIAWTDGDIDAEDSMATTIEVVAGVASDGDTVFACRRSADRSSGGMWEFPGGKVEAGESPQEALARELREELGVEVSVGSLLDRSTTVVGAIQIDLACYAVVFLGDPPTSSTDHDELRWIPRDQLGGFDWASPDLPMIRILTES